jgi:hypothetical protein
MLRALMSLFNTTLFKLKIEEKLKEGDASKAEVLKEKINSFSSRLLNESQNEILFKKNNIFYTLEIGKLQNELLSFMNEAGMIYPKKEFKPLAEIIEQDF